MTAAQLCKLNTLMGINEIIADIFDIQHFFLTFAK